MTADFNGDGFPDVAQSVNSSANNGRIGDQPGQLPRRAGNNILCHRQLHEQYCLWVATGDVNGDGKADLVAVLQGGSNAGCQTNAVAVLLGLGTGKFKKAAYYPTGATTQEENVYLVDVNGDGKLDIVTGNADGSISVLLNKGNGTYSAGTLNTSLTSIFQYGVSLTFADFNGDGKMDIAVTAADESYRGCLRAPGQWQWHLRLSHRDRPALHSEQAGRRRLQQRRKSGLARRRPV